MKTTDRITKLVLARRPGITPRSVKRDIADTCGISYEAVRQWFAGDTENIKNDNLVALAEGYDTTVDWLLSGKGEPPRRKESRQGQTDGREPERSSEEIVLQMLAKHGKGLTSEARQQIVQVVEETVAEAQSSNVIHADFSRAARAKNGDILIPQYDVRAAMGHGQVSPDYVEFLRNVVVSGVQLEKLGLEYTSPTNLSIITGWGESMAPTIKSKDPVIVDRGVTEYLDDGVYVLTWDGHLFIKRVHKAAGGKFKIISDCRPHDQELVSPEEIRIHAKVLLVWNAQRI